MPVPMILLVNAAFVAKLRSKRFGAPVRGSIAGVARNAIL